MEWRQRLAYFLLKIGNLSPAACLTGFDLTNHTHFAKITWEAHGGWVRETPNSNTPKIPVKPNTLTHETPTAPQGRKLWRLYLRTYQI